MAADNGSASEMTAHFSQSPMPIALTDTAFYITWFNKAFADFSNTDNAAAVHIASIIRIKPRNEKTFWHYCTQPPYSFKGTGYVKTPNTITKEVQLFFSPLLSSSGRPESYVVYIDDITSIKRVFLRQMFRGLLEASKLKDNDTGNHIERVNSYSRILAEQLQHSHSELGIDVDFTENIGFLAAMHDVGKIGVPDDILNKAGELDEKEWEIMKEHTINGAFILSSYPHPMAREIAIAHHEKWDGSGYPYGLSQEMIPLSARIVTLADVYDALRMKRSYKESFTHQKAKEIIISSAGTHLDPMLVELFRKKDSEFDTIFNTLTDEVPASEELLTPL